MKTNVECFQEVLFCGRNLKPGEAILLESDLVVGAGIYLAQDADCPPHLRGADVMIHYFEKDGGDPALVPQLEDGRLYYRLERKKAPDAPKKLVNPFIRRS